MRLFRRKPKWIDSPNFPLNYPPDFSSVIMEALCDTNYMFTRELDALSRLGLQKPKLKRRSELWLQPRPMPDDPYELSSVVLHFSRYECPLRFITNVYWDSVQAVCLISCSSPEIYEQIICDFNKGGLLQLKHNYKCLWLNRDPYSFFEADVYTQTIERSDLVNGSGFSKALAQRFRPLETRAPMPDERIKRRQERLLWFATLGKGADPGFDPERAASYSADSTSTNLYHFAENFPLPALPQRTASVAIKIIPPQDTRPAIFRAFLDTLRDVKSTVTFEIVAESGRIYFQLACSANDQSFIEQQLRVHFPECAIVLQNPATPVVLYTLYAVPISPYCYFKRMREFTLDPYSQLFAQISELPPDERVYVRMNFAPIPDEALSLATVPFSCQIMEEEEKIKENSQNLKIIKWLGQEDEKINEPKRRISRLEGKINDLFEKCPAWFFGVVLQASNHNRLEPIKTRFLHSLVAHPIAWKCYEGLQTDSPDFPTWSKGVFPCLNLVSTEELATLVHFPNKDIQCDRLEIVSMKTKLPPDLYMQNGIRLGTSTAHGQENPVTLPLSVRDRHLYVVGKSGTGKSTLLYNCIRQDIEQGFGVAVIDPHGDLADDVLYSIPEHRIKDTIYFNAKDTQHPIGLNILNARSEDEIGILADDLLVTFKRLSESWGERMENILRYSFHSLLRYPGATLLDIKSLLQRPDFRERVTTSLEYPALTDFWQYEYPNYPKDASAPILSRMSKFTLSPVLSGILGQAESRLNFFEIIQGKKILLVKIAKGEIGEDTAHLLGSVLVSQLQLAIMRRAALPKEARVPYFLYVDEFQNFTTSAFEKILSEARKYKLCLTLTHQYISQLDDKTKNAILANVGTIVMFQSYPADANALKPELGQYEPADVTNLSTERHEALCKPATQSKDTFKFTTLAPLPRSKDYAQTIIEQTWQSYSRVQTVNQAEPSRPVVRTQSPQPKSPEVSARSTTRFCPHCGNMLSVAARFCHSCGKPTPGTGQLTPQSKSKPIAEQPQPVIPGNYAPLSLPALALPKEFKTNQDRILYYLNLAEYLSTKQIIRLCYSHLSKTSQKAAASRDLKQLVEAKKVKTQFVGREKIFFVGKSCSPTTHNLAIRELFTKIEGSGFEIAKIDFCRKLGGLTPDLAIDFVLPDGQQLSMFWEYDAGTEGIAELESKIVRYVRAGVRGQALVFVYDARGRLEQAMRALPEGACVHAVLSEFESVSDVAFHFAPSHIASLFF